MVFSAPIFLFFFLPLCLAVYFAVPGRRTRNAVLLAFSLAFYFWGEGAYVWVLLLCIGQNYAIARLIERRRSRALVTLGVGANLLLLIAFKYADFLARSANALLAVLGSGVALPAPGLELPIGISFFVFQGISYLIDVYRRDVAAEPRLLNFATYKALFPQLIAGPIVRYRRVARAMRSRRETLSRASFGAQVFTIGLAQKVLVADQVALVADAVFDHVGMPNAREAWGALWAYSLQIYFDFVGYSNMAVGMGLIFGFAFPRNFRTPYRARSVTEFWRRWHTSLSTWFRDYLYVPLGGNRRGTLRTYLNLLLVFALCGLWHGANWNFLVWGLHHGAALVAERVGLSALLRRAGPYVARAYAVFAVTTAWVWFRTPDLEHAGRMFAALAGRHAVPTSMETYLALTPATWLALGAGTVLAFVHVRVAAPFLGPARASVPGHVRILAGSASITFLLVLALLTVAGGSFSPFLYFRF